MQIDIGIGDNERRRIAERLSVLLADSYTLYIKTHGFHWNVTGPQFHALHTLFETQYSELALAVDAIAERIRALGHRAPGSYHEFSRLATVEESLGELSAEQMVAELVRGHETVARTARDVLATAEAAGDAATADLATQRLQVHEKAAWMLRSMLAER